MGQIWHVLACLSAGLVAGALCEPLSVIFFLTRSKAVKIAADVLCGILTALVFVLIFTAFALPDLRPYMRRSFLRRGFLVVEEKFSQNTCLFCK